MDNNNGIDIELYKKVDYNMDKLLDELDKLNKATKDVLEEIKKNNSFIKRLF